MNHPSTRSALFAPVAQLARNSDPVPSRIAATHPRTHSEELQSLASASSNSTSRRRTHPGDILYWAACFGGACLLLLFALR